MIQIQTELHTVGTELKAQHENIVHIQKDIDEIKGIMQQNKKSFEDFLSYMKENKDVLSLMEKRRVAAAEGLAAISK